MSLFSLDTLADHDVKIPVVDRRGSEDFAGTIVRQALEAISSSFGEMGSEVEVRVGAIWDRKGYPQSGSVSQELSASSYRYSDGSNEDIMITVSLLVHRDQWMDSKVKDLVNRVGEAAELAEAVRKNELRQQQIEKINLLRAEADGLEEKLGGTVAEDSATGLPIFTPRAEIGQYQTSAERSKKGR